MGVADELHSQQFSFQQAIYEGINCDVGVMHGFAADASFVRVAAREARCCDVGGGARFCTSLMRNLLNHAECASFSLKPLVPAQVAPLPRRQLSQRDAAEADAFHRQHLQADGFAQVRDLSR